MPLADVTLHLFSAHLPALDVHVAGRSFPSFLASRFMLHLPCFAPLISSSTRPRTILAARVKAGAAAQTSAPRTSSEGPRSVLFASPVWPERSSSAAGVRTADLIAAFQQWGYSVAYLRCSLHTAHAHAPLHPAALYANAHAWGAHAAHPRRMSTRRCWSGKAAGRCAAPRTARLSSRPSCAKLGRQFACLTGDAFPQAACSSCRSLKCLSMHVASCRLNAEPQHAFGFMQVHCKSLTHACGFMAGLLQRRPSPSASES